MNVLPDSLIERIQFCETHLPAWLNNPSAIGLTVSQVNELADATLIARKSYDAAEAARLASRAATITMRDDVSKMHVQAANMVSQIKAFAKFQPVPSQVYSASQIPEPLSSSPSAPPGKPSHIHIALNTDGSVALSWAAKNSAAGTGAFFRVMRKLPGQSQFVGIGGTGGSTNRNRRITFVDTTLPASAAAHGARYMVQGFRANRAGETSNTFSVQFGTGGGGVDLRAGGPVKVAA